MSEVDSIYISALKVELEELKLSMKAARNRGYANDCDYTRAKTIESKLAKLGEELGT